MLALVTGANGLIGANLVRRLLARGVRVRALVRPAGDRAVLRGLPVEFAAADVRDGDAVWRALRGVDELYHLAAVYRFGAVDAAEVRSASQDGAAAVLGAAARRGGLRRIVLTSSVAAVAVTDDPAVPVDESSAWNYRGGEPYVLAKRDTERWALDFAARSGLPLVVVNPAAVMGLYDRKPTPTGSLVLEFLRGRLPAVVDSGMSVVDAEDAAEGHCLAAERGRIGERYLLAGENVTYAALGRLLAELTGLAAPWLVLPGAAALAGVWLVDRACTLLRRTPPVSYRATRDGVGRYMFCSSARARAELGYAPRSARRTLARSIAWFLFQGRVPARRVRAMSPDPLVREALAALRASDSTTEKR